MYTVKSKFSIIIFILLFPVLIAAQGLSELTYGYKAIGFDAKTQSMQNIGVADGVTVASMLINPAAVKTDKLSLSVSLGGFRLEEKRAFPVYDRFDGVVAKGTYVINKHKYGNFSFFLQSGILKENYNFTVGAFSVPFSNFTYDYKENVRENDYGDRIIGFNKIEGEGFWRLSGINLQMSPMKNLSVGMNVGMITESEAIKYGVVTHYEDIYSLEEDSVSFSKRGLDNSPLFIQLGGLYNYNERWSYGLQVKFPVTFELNSTNPRKDGDIMETYSTIGDSMVSEKFSHPLEISGGFVYNARTPFKTRLFVDFGYQFYSSMEHEIGSRSYENLNNTFYLGTAMEFTYLHQNTFTFSYKFSNNPTDKSFTMSQFGVGLGFPIPGGEINLGTGFAKRDYLNQDLFEDSLFGGDRTQSTYDDVTENYIYGSVGVVFYIK